MNTHTHQQDTRINILMYLFYHNLSITSPSYFGFYTFQSELLTLIPSNFEHFRKQVFNKSSLCPFFFFFEVKLISIEIHTS